ncbi:hypothetical protein EYF80_059718 [Liparis tanakae]|uniref:Uncharacterized protein n=1 Tax=Liparis tanakae TaxID=230148 RepID=A0A4Z2ENI1_9TELE|nr:hypothetical protein EYF80_059718 [Liparis tanakae]
MGQLEEEVSRQVTVFELSQQLDETLQPPLLPRQLLVESIVLVPGRREREARDGSEKQTQVHKVQVITAVKVCHLHLSLALSRAPPSLPGVKWTSAASSLVCPRRPDSRLSAESAAGVSACLRRQLGNYNMNMITRFQCPEHNYSRGPCGVRLGAMGSLNSDWHPNQRTRYRRWETFRLVKQKRENITGSTGARASRRGADGLFPTTQI